MFEFYTLNQHHLQTKDPVLFMFLMVAPTVTAVLIAVFNKKHHLKTLLVPILILLLDSPTIGLDSNSISNLMLMEMSIEILQSAVPNPNSCSFTRHDHRLKRRLLSKLIRNLCHTNSMKNKLVKLKSVQNTLGKDCQRQCPVLFKSNSM